MLESNDQRWPNSEVKSVVYGLREARIGRLAAVVKSRLLSRLVRRSASLFVRGGDYLSLAPLLGDIHEKELIELLRALAECGYSDALIDIGANIGLTSFYAKEFFKRAYCFEPNPKVFHILSANLYGRPEVYLFPYALGLKDETSTLTIPKTNYGGAFILHEDNAYSTDQLSSKEGHSVIGKEDYEELKIEIKSGRIILASIFAENQGGIVLKIDTEGFEPTILKEIAAALPIHRRFAIVFENLSDEFMPEAFLKEHFGPSIKIYKLEATVDSRTTILKKLWQLLGHGQRYYLTVKPRDWIGTILLTDSGISVSLER